MIKYVFFQRRRLCPHLRITLDPPGLDPGIKEMEYRRNGVAIIVNKRVQNAGPGGNLKNDRMISVHFQGKLFNIIVIQVYALISNAEEAEVEWFYEDLQDLLELTPKKDVLFIIATGMQK